jgi:hypothetical protein
MSQEKKNGLKYDNDSVLISSYSRRLFLTGLALADTNIDGGIFRSAMFIGWIKQKYYSTYSD